MTLEEVMRLKREAGKLFFRPTKQQYRTALNEIETHLVRRARQQHDQAQALLRRIDKDKNAA